MSDKAERGEPKLSFETDDLGGRAARASAVSLLGQVLRFGLHFIGFAILSRLLTPEDFGLIAMVTVVVGFVNMFRDAGLSVATIQQKELSTTQLEKLFWINATLGLVLALVTVALAPLVAWFYGEPRLVQVTMVLGAGFVLSGLTVQHEAVLHRQMRFVALVGSDLTARAIALAAAIAGALWGLRYWALVTQQLAVSLVMLLGVWLTLRWLPRRGWGDEPVVGAVKKGAYLTGFNVINYFARNLDNALIGWRWGSVQLGYYSRAYALFLLPITQLTAPLNAVAIPTLSRLQGEPERFRDYYLTGISVIFFVASPLTAGIVLLSDEVIRLVLGSQWAPAAPVLRYLGISIMAQPFSAAIGWLYLALGNMRRMFFVGLVGVTWICLAIVVGLPFGIEGLALCYSIAILIWVWPALLFATRGTPVATADILKAIWKPVIAALVAGAGAMALLEASGAEAWLTRMLIGGSSLVVAYLIVELGIFRDGQHVMRALSALRGKVE